MDDIDIRTYIGQEDPTNDDFNAKANEITMMRDAAGRQTGYSNNNREVRALSVN